MKKIYISVDLEGINGVVKPEQTVASGGLAYKRSLEQMHLELNTVIDTLFQEKIEHITVNDAHDSMINIGLNEIHPKVELISGKPKSFSMVYSLDETYDGVFFIGYHAKAGSEKGVLPHTFHPLFRQVLLNGKPVSEAKMNSIYAGLKGVPAIMITGDNITCNQAESDIGNIKTVETKQAISAYCAKCRPNDALLKELYAATKEAITDQKFRAVDKESAPYTIEVDFVKKDMAMMAEFIPGIKKTGASVVSYTSDNFEDIYKMLQFITGMVSK